MQANRATPPRQKISQSDARRIYCLTQKDIDNIKQASSAKESDSHTGTPANLMLPLDDAAVREYALRKHGGTQQGIELAIVEKQGAKLQREAIMRTNVLVRKGRAIEVKKSAPPVPCRRLDSVQGLKCHTHTQTHKHIHTSAACRVQGAIHTQTHKHIHTSAACRV